MVQEKVDIMAQLICTQTQFKNMKHHFTLYLFKKYPYGLHPAQENPPVNLKFYEQSL